MRPLQALKLGHRFLVTAHETFTLLAAHPDMGWEIRLKHPSLRSLRLFRVKGFEKILVLYLPMLDGLEIVRLFHGSRDLQVLLSNL